MKLVVLWLLLLGLGTVCGEVPLPPGAVARLDTSWVADIAFSPDGEYLTLAVKDTVEVRSGKDLDYLGSIGLPEGKRALALAFVTLERLVAGCTNGSLLLLNFHLRSVEKEIGAFSGRIWGLAISPGRRYIACASDDGGVAVYTFPALDEAFRLRAHPGGAFSLAFSPSGKVLASGGQNGGIKLWGIPTGELLKELRGHSATVWDLEFITEGRFLSAGSDGKCILWDTEAGNAVCEIVPGVQRIREVAFQREHGLFAMAASDVDVLLWSEVEGEIIGRVRGHITNLWTLALSPDGRYLATVSSDGRLILWDVDELLALRPRITGVHYTREMKRYQMVGVSFEDPNGDISMAEIKLLEGDKVTVHITPSKRMQIQHYRGKKSGFFFTFGVRVEKPQKIVLRIIVIDLLGLRSEETIEIEAQG